MKKAAGPIRQRRKAISSGTGAIRREPRRTTVPRSSPANRSISIWPRALSLACAFIPRRSSVSRTPSRFTSAMSIKADGRCRIFAFAGADDPAAASSGIRRLCDFLAGGSGFPGPKIYAPRRGYRLGDRCARGVPASPSRSRHRDHAGFSSAPEGTLRTSRLREMFCADIKGGNDIFAMRGIDREAGCMVVVRPDQYVAHVLPLDGYEQLAAFFDGFMLPHQTRCASNDRNYGGLNAWSSD